MKCSLEKPCLLGKLQLFIKSLNSDLDVQSNKVFLLKITLTSAISNCYHSVPLWMLVKHQQITIVLHKNTRCRHHVCKTSEITDLLVLDHSVLWQKHLVSTVAWKWNDYCLDLNMFLNVDLLFTDSLTYKRVWYVGCIFF
jgi:hypothetical protein